MKDITKIYNLQSLNFLQNCQLNVGILGGSFNPAHSGHLNLSYQAIKILELDYIIWLVALQNPFKKQYIFDIFARAFKAAQIVKHPQILVSSAEYDIGACHTYFSLKKLKELFNNLNFTFLMGVDNINNFHKWYRYHDILNLCQIVVFDRPNILSRLNFDRFNISLKANVDKKQTDNIMLYRGIMSEMSSSMIRKKMKDNYAK